MTSSARPCCTLPAHHKDRSEAPRHATRAHPAAPERRRAGLTGHLEAFSQPPGATRLASNAASTVQAFALGPHVALQFHVELDAAKLSQWAAESTERDRTMRQRHPRTVHAPEALVAGAGGRLAAQQALAARVYGHWLSAA